MWGAHGFGSPLTLDAGIIPADVGSTAISALIHTSRGDHPRGCGEHPAKDVMAGWNTGSSPRMWGAHLEILAIPTIQ